MPVKVLDPTGLGQDSDIIQGIMWATDNGASVILMAFSATGYSLALQDAIDYAWVQNVVLVAAAGNEASNTPTFPAGDRGVIGVSATDQNDILAPSSTIGGSVFLAAPGVDILGTYPNNSYVTWSGTSASAAIVAGTAALMRAVDPSLSNGVVVNRIALTADVAGTPERTGNGRVTVSRAINETSTDALQPAGAAPFGNGGPFVGPYRIAAKTLTLAFSGNGSGSVTSTGAPLPQFSCTDTAGVASGTCSANLNNNDLVNFTATAASGSSIGTWTLSQVTIQSGCTSGSTTCNVKMGNAAATVTLSINPLPTKLAFTALVFSIAVGQCSGTVTVQSQTASKVASNVTSTTTVHLSRNSGNGAFYSDAACSTALVGDNVTIANGTSSTNFFFKDTIAGGPTITAHQTAGTPALTDATQTETINKASTSTAVTSNPNPSTTGELVTFTAIISVTAPGAGSPSGIVNFTDGGTTITGCGTQPVSANQATCTTALLSITSHTIAAAYSGDINFNGSTSGNLTQVVNPAPFFKAVISPTTDVVNHSTAAYSITVTDCNNAACPTQGNVNDTIIVVNIDIPADYSGVAVTTVSSTGHTWDSVVASGQIQLTAHSSTDKLSPGEAVTVNFTATTPSTLAADPTSEPWNAHAFGGQNNTKPIVISSNGQPAVSVSRRATSTAVTFAANPITYGQNTTATITVTDTEATGTKSNPGVGDTVSVISDSSDTITGTCTLTITGTCTLAAVPATTDRSSCQVTITPTHASVHRISATFTATTVHKTSNGSSALTVDKKTLTASIVNDPTKTYNGNTDATLIPSNFSLSGLAGSETFTIGQTSGTYNSKDVLTTPNTVTASLSAGDFTPGSGTSATNYNLPTSASGPGHIGRATAGVVVTPYTSDTTTCSSEEPRVATECR